MIESTLERGMPASIEAERSILGSILLDGALWEQAASLVPDHFSLDAHRRIFSRMKSLRDAGFPIDMITLSEELDRHKEVESVGGVAYISDLITLIPDRPSIESYIRIVKGKALLRGLINISQNAIAEAVEHADEPEEVISRVERAIVALSNDSIDVRPLVSLCDATIPAYEAMFKQEERGLTTSIADLDLKTHGICPEDFWIIGGDPGSGKSALIAQILAENGRNGRRSGMWSIEMKLNRVMRRLWCYESSLFYSKLRDNPDKLSPVDRQYFEDAVKSVATWPVSVNDASSLTPQAFIAQARKAVLRDKIELAALDHIQIMVEAMPGKDDLAKIREIAGILRQFAKDYCPVIALSQLSRQNKEQRGKRPVMADLYGGRFLEMNATVIAMCWLPEENEEPTHEDEIVLAKNREGETRSVPVLFRGALMRFESRETRL